MGNLFASLAQNLAQEDRLRDPVVWAREKAGIELWSKQQEIVQSLEKNKQVAVRSAHGTGKSLLAAVIACWWIDTHPIGEAYVISTAPSRQQVHSVLWEEMRNIHTTAKLPGTIQASDKWIVRDPVSGKDKEVGIGRRPADHQPYSFQGIHRDAVLFILDEAGGIPKWLWDAGIAITTNEQCRILAIGNPDDPNSEFRQKFDEGSDWHNIKISVFDSPNFTDEPVTEIARKRLTDYSFVRTAERDWGIGTALWQSKVLGDFPDEDENAVIPVSWVEEAFNRNDLFDDLPEVDIPELETAKIVSVDVAYTGRDSTVITKFRHPRFERPEAFHPRSQKELALLIKERTKKMLDKIVIDVGGGYGSGVYEQLRDEGYNIVAFNGGNKTDKMDSTRKFGFTRIRSAAFWNVREKLNPYNDDGICLPRMDEIRKDLTVPKYEIQLDKIQVETKDSIRKRLKRSTDYGDTIMMALWVPPPILFLDSEVAFSYGDINPDSVTGVYSYEGGEEVDGPTFRY